MLITILVFVLSVSQSNKVLKSSMREIQIARLRHTDYFFCCFNIIYFVLALAIGWIKLAR